MLSLEFDPKLAWAMAHPERFPVDLNRAPKEMLLRVPGVGIKAVERMLQAAACGAAQRRPGPAAPAAAQSVAIRRAARPPSAGARPIRRRLARRLRRAPLQASLF